MKRNKKGTFVKIKKCIKDPKFLVLVLVQRGIIPMSDKSFLKLKFKEEMGYKLDLGNPQTFNEKLQWLKLYDRNPLYTKMVDKADMKKYVESKIGKEYIIQTLGVYDDFDEIDFKSLPEKFVIKCTHDSGTVIICKDKKIFDIAMARNKINRALRKNFYYQSREWPYKNVKPRVLVEEYIEDKKDKELRDYKFYCFNGEPHALLLATDRMSGKELCFDYFDMDFKHLKLTNHWHPNAKRVPHKPDHFEDMKKLARKLSEGIPQVRVDFYEANGKVYVGELTFFDMGGYLKIHPDDWDKEWGSMIRLPQNNK